MRAILLAGGTGSRLSPLTVAVNKHLLPIGNTPMIGRAFDLLYKLGVNEVLLIVSPDDLTGFSKLISSGLDPYDSFKSIYIAIQKHPLGIANAVSYGRSFVKYGEPVLIMLGDNLFSQDDYVRIAEDVKGFEKGAHIWIRKVRDPSSVGVLVFDTDGNPTAVVEKPKEHISDFGVTGLYLVDYDAWEIIDNLRPSARGEYEVTDILTAYLNRRRLRFTHLVGDWLDLGQSLGQFWASVDRIRSCTF